MLGHSVISSQLDVRDELFAVTHPKKNHRDVLGGRGYPARSYTPAGLEKNALDMSGQSMKKPAPMLTLLWVAALALVVSFAVHARSQRDATALTIDQSFIAFWQAAKDKPFAEQQRLWDQFIEEPREAVYQSVVWEVRDNPNWRQQKEKELRVRFVRYQSMSQDIPEEVRSINEALRVQAKRLAQYFGASEQPRAMVLLAPNFDAKSGVLPNGDPVLALSADTLILERASLDIVLPHELFHLWDAEHSGITNDGVMPGTHLLLPLFEEGLATYVSTVVSPGHSDGEYLLQDDLGALSDAKVPAIAKRFLLDAETPTIDPAKHAISKAYTRWFQTQRAQIQADLPNRSGYWLGLHTIRALTHRHTLDEIASWSPSRAEQETRAALIALAQGEQAQSR